MKLSDHIPFRTALLNAGQYFKQEFKKTQIYIHHTVSSASPKGDIAWWNQTKSKIATAFIIAGEPATDKADFIDGEVFNVFASKYWAYHLGVKGSYNAGHKLDKGSIGIELDTWGPVEPYKGKFTPVAHRQARGSKNPYIMFDKTDVIEYPNGWRGYRYFLKYTDAQIESLKYLLLYLTDIYNIPRDYVIGTCDLDEQALKEKPGIWSHTSVRKDKSDIHPQGDLLQMLMRLRKTQM